MTNKTTVIFLAIVAAIFLVQSQVRGEDGHSKRSHSFSDMDKYVKMLENPKRATWQKPDEVVRMMNLTNGDHVADVGAGTGYFTRRIAKAVAPGGSVTGYDTEKNMVEYMRKDAKKLGYGNYRAEVVAAKNPVYPADRFDVILMCNIYHHVDDRSALLGALAKSLKKTGRIVLIEQKMEAQFGPPKSMRIEKRNAIAEFGRAGFVPVKDENFLPDQYYLEFRVK